MNKSVSMMNDVKEVCEELRPKFFGQNATLNEYRDSFVANAAVERFTEDPDVLFTEAINEKEQNCVKAAKSINFRSDNYAKITEIANIYQKTEAEILRRILYYWVDFSYPDDPSIIIPELNSLRNRAKLLRKRIAECNEILDALLEEIGEVEGKAVNGYISI